MKAVLQFELLGTLPARGARPRRSAIPEFGAVSLRGDRLLTESHATSLRQNDGSVVRLSSTSRIRLWISRFCGFLRAVSI